jgi:hypothetical protein
VSIGVASISPYYDTQDTLVRKADEALYRAKAFGRNRVWPAVEDFRPGTEPAPAVVETDGSVVTDIRTARATVAL